MVKRGSRLSKRVRRGRKLKPAGYWKIPKTGLPPSEVLAQLRKKPLDYGKYARTKNGGK